MLQNKMVAKPMARLEARFQGSISDGLTPFRKQIWYFCDEFSPESCDACHDFEIEGGIWDLIIKTKSQILSIREKLMNGTILGT
jgi:hypothetical protein